MLSRKFLPVLLVMTSAVMLSPAPTLAQSQTEAQSEAQTEAQSAFDSLLENHWDHVLKNSPTFATTLGVRDYDDRLASNTLASYEQNLEALQGFRTQAESIDESALSATDQLTLTLFKLDLDNDLSGADYGDKYLLMTNRNGPHTYLSRLPDNLPFFTEADYDSYIARLNDVPRYLSETIVTLKAGIAEGWTQPCESMVGVSDSIRFHIPENIDDSVFLKPFATRPSTISERKWKSQTRKARRAIERKVIPAWEGYADFYDADYAPACRKDIGASTYPNGLEYYQYRANVFTTTDQTPDEIHNVGLSEVARIRAEMATIIESVDFDGSFKDFQTFLRTDPQFYAKTEKELIAETSLISKRIDGELPRLFTKLPRMPYTVKPVPADIAEGTTTAYYERPAGDGSRAGVYRINTSLLDQRPLFELEALSLHEAVPGHHFQIALSQELDLPPFRAYGGFTAFVEGWGLYAERLGLDVGFYQDPYANFGRLSYEMWRACRLVVDTGMHAKGWTRQQAIDFMTENTALSDHNIKSEIDRYITWPGQALAYKIGEMKIRELRKRANDALGADFDIRTFHDAVLANGAIPLSVLEAEIDRYIAEQSGDDE